MAFWSILRRGDLNLITCLCQVSSSSWREGQLSAAKIPNIVSCAHSCHSLEQNNSCSCNAVSFTRSQRHCCKKRQQFCWYICHSVLSGLASVDQSFFGSLMTNLPRESGECIRGVASLPVGDESTEEVYVLHGTGTPGLSTFKWVLYLELICICSAFILIAWFLSGWQLVHVGHLGNLYSWMWCQHSVSSLQSGDHSHLLTLIPEYMSLFYGSFENSLKAWISVISSSEFVPLYVHTHTFWTIR